MANDEETFTNEIMRLPDSSLKTIVLISSERIKSFFSHNALLFPTVYEEKYDDDTTVTFDWGTNSKRQSLIMQVIWTELQISPGEEHCTLFQSLDDPILLPYLHFRIALMQQR